MWLQLALALCVIALAAPAVAQEVEPGDGQATTRLLVYSDDDATSVVTSAVDASAVLPGRVTLGAHALVDVVSSASVDVVSAATGRWDETRVEAGARAQTILQDTQLGLGYTRSQENDWLSNAVFVSASRELFQKNTVVSASYGLTLNTVGRASDPNFERSLDSHSAEAGVSQLIDGKTRVGGAYTLQVLSGYISSPYRFVSATDGTRVPERHPDSRIRHALSAFVVRSLIDQLSGRIGYRLYSDDWGIRSHTISARLAFEATDWLMAGVEGRAYLQNRADFYRGTYDTSYEYMTFDRELSTFWDAGGTADISASLGPVTADLKVGAIYYKFDDFPALSNRTALVAGGGARVVW